MSQETTNIIVLIILITVVLGLLLPLSIFIWRALIRGEL